jgi:hypothetical protein
MSKQNSVSGDRRKNFTSDSGFRRRFYDKKEVTGGHTEEELGACYSCHSLKFNGPCKTDRKSGELMVICGCANGCWVPVQTDIESPEYCKYKP